MSEMKPGDLVQISSDGFDITQWPQFGTMIRRLVDSTVPKDWPRILILWCDGKLESMHENDLKVVDEAR